MKPHTYDPTKPGELFELQDNGRIECKACGKVVWSHPLHAPNAEQTAMRHHAETEQEVNGKKTSCRGFWEGAFPERFGR